MTVVTPEFDATQLMAPSPRVTGSVMRAPLGTALPTSSFAVVNTAFTDLGYSDENGLKQKEDRSNTDVFAWGGDLVGTLQDKYSRTMSLKLLQFVNEDVLITAYGTTNVTSTPATTDQGTEFAVKMNPKLLDTVSWVFDGFYKDILCRVVIPIGRVTAIGDVDFTHKMFTTVDCTIKAYPDAAKNHGYLYVNDGFTTLDGS